MTLSAAAPVPDTHEFDLDAFHDLTQNLITEAERPGVVRKTGIALPLPMDHARGAARWNLSTGGRLHYEVERDKISVKGFLDRDGKEPTHALSVAFVRDHGPMRNDHFEVQKIAHRPVSISDKAARGRPFVLPRGLSVGYWHGLNGYLINANAYAPVEPGLSYHWIVEEVPFNLVDDGPNIEPIFQGSTTALDVKDNNSYVKEVRLALRHSGILSEPGNLSFDITSLRNPLKHGQRERVNSLGGPHELDQRVQLQLGTDRIRHMVAYAIAEMLKIGRSNARRRA